MTVGQLAARALQDLATAADKARTAAVYSDQDPAAHLLARLAVEADAARARVEALTADVRAAGRGVSMYGHDSQPSIVYRYGARTPVEGLDVVREQMRLAHHYRNDLCRREHDRRDAVADVLRRLAPGVMEAEAAFRAADEAAEAAVAAAIAAKEVGNG